VPPTFAAALGFGLGALRRASWLVAPALVVAFARRALLWPAAAVAWTIVVRAALLALADAPLNPAAPLGAIVTAVSSTRFLALVAGLWLVGLLAGALLRVVFLAGALPTLGAAAAGAAASARFASGVAYRTPRVLGAASLALAVDLSGALFRWTLVVAAVVVSVAADSRGPLLALAVAAALTLAVAVPLALSTVADAAVARAALRDERPAGAFAAAARRFLARPGTFLLAGLAFGLAAVVGPAAVEGMSGVFGALGRAHPAAALGPTLMLGLAAAVVAAFVDLLWLGTVAALASAEDRAPASRR
jgi:hypothetical protein